MERFVEDNRRVVAQRVAPPNDQPAVWQVGLVEVERDAGRLGEIATRAVIGSVREDIAGQRRRLVLKLLRIIFQPIGDAIDTQVGRQLRPIGIGRIAIDIAKDLFRQHQRFGSHQRPEVPELSERESDEGLTIVVIEALVKQLARRSARLDRAA